MAMDDATPKTERSERLRSILARRVDYERGRRGWTQTELAERAGTSIPTINRILKKNRWPSDALIQQIADAFGITPERLLSEDLSDTYPIAQWLDSMPPEKRKAALKMISAIADMPLPDLPNLDD